MPQLEGYPGVCQAGEEERLNERVIRVCCGAAVTLEGPWGICGGIGGNSEQFNDP